MPFNQRIYTDNYNKNHYKTYSFRLKCDDELNTYLSTIKNKNKYITSLIEKDKYVLTLKEIKTRIKPIMTKHKIEEVYLFGSYSRGEATASSDIDIYCDMGDIKTLYDQIDFEEELETALEKKVDVIFTTSRMNPYFKNQIMEDMIKLSFQQETTDFF